MESYRDRTKSIFMIFRGIVVDREKGALLRCLCASKIKGVRFVWNCVKTEAIVEIFDVARRYIYIYIARKLIIVHSLEQSCVNFSSFLNYETISSNRDSTKIHVRRTLNLFPFQNDGRVRDRWEKLEDTTETNTPHFSFSLLSFMLNAQFDNWNESIKILEVLEILHDCLEMVGSNW